MNRNSGRVDKSLENYDLTVFFADLVYISSRKIILLIRIRLCREIK